VDTATFIYAMSNKREDMTLRIGIMGLGRCNVDTTSSKLLYWSTRPKLLPTPNPKIPLYIFRLDQNISSNRAY